MSVSFEVQPILMTFTGVQLFCKVLENCAVNENRMSLTDRTISCYVKVPHSETGYMNY